MGAQTSTTQDFDTLGPPKTKAERAHLEWSALYFIPKPALSPPSLPFAAAWLSVRRAAGAGGGGRSTGDGRPQDQLGDTTSLPP